MGNLPNYVAFNAKVYHCDTEVAEPLYKHRVPDDDQDVLHLLIDNGRLRTTEEANSLSSRSVARCKNYIVKKDTTINTFKEGETVLQEYQCVINLIQRIRRLYHVCLRLIRDTNPPNVTEAMFDLLDASKSLQIAYNNNVSSMYSSFMLNGLPASAAMQANERYLLKTTGQIDFAPIMYMADIFGRYMTYNGYSYVDKYRKVYNNLYRINNSEIKEDDNKVRFWNKPDLINVLRDEFGNYCRMNEENDSYVRFLRSFAVKDIADLIIDSLDSYMSRELNKSNLSVSSRSQTVKWSSNNWLVIEHIFLYLEILYGREYRRCAYCGALFLVQGHRTVYCQRHTEEQLRSFRKQKRRKGL